MKLKLIAAILSALIFCIQVRALEFVDYTDQGPVTSTPIPKSMFCSVLMMITVAVGGGVVIWLYLQPGCLAGKRLILERDCNLSGNWQPVATNDVLEPIPNTHSNQWARFAHVIDSPTNDPTCKSKMFRLKVIDIPKE